MDWHTPRIQEPADEARVFYRDDLDKRARKTRWAQTTASPPQPKDLAGMTGTAYCPTHDRIERFSIIGDVKIGPDERKAFDEVGGRRVSIETTCGHIQQIVTANRP